MPKTIRYIGTQNYWPEVAYTGRPTRWMPGMADECPDNVANALLATGLFRGVLQSVYLDSVTRQAVDAAGNAIGGGAPIVISGVPAAGNTLTATISPGWRNSGGNWTRDGANISGATALTYPLVSADNDKDVTYASSNIPYTPPALRIGAAAPVAPGAPTIGTATAGDGVVNVVFSAPASTGGSPILEYQAELSNASAATGSGSPIPVPSPNGAAVTGRVRARNAVDWGPWSANSNSVTPSAGATVPGAPTAVSATAGDGTVSATWSAPASNGGAPIDDYRLSWNGGAPVAMGDADLNGSISAANGTPGTLTVAAHNSAGWGPASAASNSVTPTASVPALRASAPFDAQLSGTQSSSVNTGRIALGNVTLRTTGDWSIYVQTNLRTAALNGGGGIISIGDASDSIMTAASSLVLGQFGSGASNPWVDGSYPGALFLTAQDDANSTATSRYPISTMAPGSLKPYPMIGKASYLARAGNANHGLLVTCEAGVISLYDVDPGMGPILQDQGPGIGASRNDDTAVFFTGITNKPMYLGFVNQLTQNSQTTRTYWGGPISQVVVYNGGVITPAQARLLAQGIDARDVLAFNSARGDRYWPGSQVGGQLEELIAGQHGTVEGVGITFPATTRPQLVDASVTCGWRPGTVFPAAKSPATTTTMRVWGTRRGPSTEIQYRVLTDAAAYPAVAGDIVVDWVTVATAGGASGEFAYQGDIPGVPHGGAWFSIEHRYKKVDGSWSDPVRLQGNYSLGDGCMVVGQSIVQNWCDKAGTRAVSAAAQGLITHYDKFFPIYSRDRVDSKNRNGWLNRSAASYTDKYGVTLCCDLLSQITGRRSYIMNLSIAGVAIARFIPGTSTSAATWPRLKEAIQEARLLNFMFNNGQGDASMNQSARWNALDALYAAYEDAINTAPGGAWTGWTFWVIPVGSDFSTAGGLNSIRGYDMEWVKQRKAEGKHVGLMTTLTDQPNSLDGTHPNSTLLEMGCMSERIAEAIAYNAGFRAYDGNGGFFETATWSHAAGTLTVQLPITGGNGTYATKGGGNPSGWRITIDGVTVVPTTTALAGNVVTLTYSTATVPSVVRASYLSGYPGPTGGGPTTPETTSGIDNALYDVRTGQTPNTIVSASKGMPVCATPFGVLATPA